MAFKKCTQCELELDFSFFNKSKNGRYGLKAECKNCSALRFKIHYNNNSEKLKHKSSVFREENKENIKIKSREYYQLNKQKIKDKVKTLTSEQIKSKNKKYYQKNKTKVRDRNKLWLKNNAGKVNFYSAKRRSTKKTATPKSLNKKDFEDIYSYYFLAKELSIAAGVKFSVDHIVPLTHQSVCGLHVPWNLQLLTYSENCSKHNKFQEEYFYDTL